MGRGNGKTSASGEAASSFRLGDEDDYLERGAVDDPNAHDVDVEVTAPPPVSRSVAAISASSRMRTGVTSR